MNKKEKRISSKIIFLNVLLFCVFFLVLGIFYLLIIPYFYEAEKKKSVTQLYEEMKEMDLSDLSESDIDILKEYEERGSYITIADSDMNLIYNTNDRQQNPVHSNIQIHMDEFTKDAQVSIHRSMEQGGYVKLRIIIDQKDGHFYVAIRNLSNASEFFRYVNRYLLIILMIYFILNVGLQKHYLENEERNLRQILNAQELLTKRNLPAMITVNSASGVVEELADRTNELGKVFQKERQQILRENMRWERLEKQRKEYIATMSHELKTPLAVISSQTELLGMKEKNLDSYVQSIQEEVDKIYDRVKRLLEYSVQENQFDNMIFRNLNMSELVSEQLKKYEGIFSKRCIHLEKFISEGCIVHGDGDYLEQAFCNYMTNAIEHTASGGTIRISIKRVKNNVKVAVYNEGEIIPEEDIDDIWSGFYSKNNDKQAHAGLGLFIVNTIITLHKGEVGVKNQKNGVEFWFTLPLFEK